MVYYFNNVMGGHRKKINWPAQSCGDVFCVPHAWMSAWLEEAGSSLSNGSIDPLCFHIQNLNSQNKPIQKHRIPIFQHELHHDANSSSQSSAILLLGEPSFYEAASFWDFFLVFSVFRACVSFGPRNRSIGAAAKSQVCFYGNTLLSDIHCPPHWIFDN